MASSFRFRGKDSYTDFNIILQKKTRPLIPQKNDVRTEVYGKDGSINISGEKTYKDILISCECTCMTTSFSEKRILARRIAEWLSESGELEFSDELGLYYSCEVINQLDFEDIASAGHFVIEFLCAPFAYKAPAIMLIKSGENPINYEGTARTPTLIILRNETQNTARTIKLIIRKKVK